MRAQRSRLRALVCALAALAVGAAVGLAQAPPTLTTQPLSQTVLVGATVTLQVTASGAGPFSYQWQVNGAALSNGIITTVAGNGTQGYAGDGGASTNASLANPSGVVVDRVGNLFIADTDNNRIRKVGSDGVITTVAGNGIQGFSGDGESAIHANLANPLGEALDSAGNLFIADSWNNCVRRVDTNGIITTVAGSGTQGYSGDGGAATNAALTAPAGVALDSAGNLFIADSLNNRIRKVDTSGIISTIAGNGTPGYSGDDGPATNASVKYPNGLAVDHAGNLLIADAGNNRIRRVDNNGVITTLAGNSQFTNSGDGGPATNASLASPSSVALDPAGNLFIADQYSYRIRQVDTNGIITTVAGTGTLGYSGDGYLATNASLANPSAVTLDGSGNLFITDNGNSRIRKVALSDRPTLTLANVSAADAGDYQVTITNPYGSVTSVVATISVVSPPIITNQPAGQLAQPGAAVTLQVGAVGTGPMSYQWRLNGTNLPDSSVANLASLTLTNVSVADAGDYQVTISNPYGSVTSSIAALTLAVPPTITAQPASQAVPLGGTLSLQVKATGVGPLRYQWQCNGTNLLNGVITTFAGGGVGDGGLATNASLLRPSGVAWDLAGNPLIADTGNSRIRKVDTNGIITTVAGSGSSGYSGDGGPATRAGLDQPATVTADGSGNWLIADGAHNVIRRVAADGTITTIAGNGRRGYLGDGGAATNASLANPSGLALDSGGNLFIADSSNSRIRKVDTNGIITTVAGTRTAGFAGDGGAATNASLANPSGVAVDLAGNVFITDQYNNRIRRIDTNGLIATVAGNGRFGYGGDGRAATNASLANPAGLAIDRSGNLLIADSNNARIRKMDTNGIITTVAGNGQFGYSGDGGAATKASLANPVGVAVDRIGNLLIADPFWNCIRKVSTNGIITTVAGSNSKRVGDGGAATSASLQSPAGLAVDTVGNLLVADTGNTRVRRVGVDQVITTLAGSGTPGYPGDGGPATNASLVNPSGVAVDAAGNVFIADSWNNRIREVDTRGIIHAVAGNGRWGYLGDGGAATNASLANPSGVAVDSAGNLFIADNGNHCIRQVDADGLITTLAGNGQFGYSGDGGAATRANLSGPRGVAVDSAGTVFVADTDNNRIRKVDTNGVISTVAGNGQFGYFGDGGPAANARLANPAGVAVDLAGNLFIADQGTARIRRVGADGIITTVAGNGTQGFAGDGGAATNASLANPSGVAVYGLGRVFIADTQNSRIRQVVLSDFPTLILTGVSATNAGDYQVTITNPFGSVTSLVARVTVASSPIVLSIRAGPALGLQLSGQSGALYVLQAATNLTLPVQWQPVFTNAADANGLWSYTETNASALPARFYRARPAQ